jgi:hypothetical protein
MPTPDRFFEDALALAQRFALESAQRQRRHHRRRRHGHPRVARVLRRVALLLLFTLLMVPALIAGAFMFAPYGFLALLAAPFLLVLTWVVVLRRAFRKPLPTPLPAAMPALLASADLARLPEQTEAWIAEQRRLLPWAAQSELEQITQKLLALTPQLKGLKAESPAGSELKRLLGEELPTLVQSYRKVPSTLAQAPFYDGPSPEQKLIAGLAIIDGELGRMHTRLARDDLHALAAHQRYLELKYERKENADS